jgi:hypothetical protein
MTGFSLRKTRGNSLIFVPKMYHLDPVSDSNSGGIFCADLDAAMFQCTVINYRYTGIISNIVCVSREYGERYAGAHGEDL